MTTQAERQRKIERLANLPELLERVVAGLTPEQLTTRYIENEWTSAQNVHHVFDSHARGYVNGKLILSDESPPLKRYNQDAWALMADAGIADIGASLTLIRALHARWAVWWRSLSDTDFARTGQVIGAPAPVTLDVLLDVYSGHGEDHCQQIIKTLAAGGIERASA
jgi:DinB superfamily